VHINIAEQLRAKSWMVLGKFFLILTLTSGNAQAQSWFSSIDRYIVASSPEFLYSVIRNITRRIPDWARQQHEMTMFFALESVEDGKTAQWHDMRGFTGTVMPISTLPTSSGYCRRIYHEVRTPNANHDFQDTACWSETNKKWVFVNK